MSAGLACRHLAYAPATATTGRPPILNDLTLACAPGAVTLISGPTGTGKTTLLGLLAGLLRPTGGTVTAEGEPISRWAAPHRDRWRRQVGLAFQQPRLLPELTALENVMLPLIPRGLPPLRIRRRSLAALASMDAAALAHRRAAALSGGEGQRVGLARALAIRPRYLLVDEPTSQQDAAGVARVLAVLAAACARGAVVVATSHDPRLLAAAAIDRHHRLVDGRLDTLS